MTAPTRRRGQTCLGAGVGCMFPAGRIDELNTALDEWLAQTKGNGAATGGTHTRNRDRANTYLQIMEFPRTRRRWSTPNFRDRRVRRSPRQAVRPAAYIPTRGWP